MGTPLELLFRIAADNAPLKGTLAESQAAVKSTNAAISEQTIASSNTTAEAMRRTIAESLKMQGTTADQAAQIYKQMGLSGTQSAREIAAAFGTTTAAGQAAGAAGQAMGAGVAAGAAAGSEAADTQLTPAVKRATMEIRQATVAAMILERQLGIALPRGINAMIGRSELLGGILTKVFAVTILVYLASQIDKIVEKIGEAGMAAGGFGAKAKKAAEDAVEANNKLLTSFKDVKTGYSLEAETLRNAAALEKQKTALEAQVGTLKQIATGFRDAALGAVTFGTSTLISTVEGRLALKNLNDAIAANTQRNIETGEQLGKVTIAQARLNLEVLKAKDAALGAGKARSDQLKIELAEVTNERDLEVREAAGSSDKIAAVYEKYKWKRIQLEGEITKALADEAAKQNKPLQDALNKYNEMLGRLESQYDSGNSAARRYLETERQLGELEAKGINTWAAQKLNVQILDKERTEALTKATEEATRALEAHHLQMPVWLNDMMAAGAAFAPLAAAERAQIPLLGDESSALARLAASSKIAVEQMEAGELPARQRINIMIAQRIGMADREILAKQRELTQGKITLAQFEAAEIQYTNAFTNLSKQRQLMITQEVEGTMRRELQNMRRELETTQLSILHFQVFGTQAFMQVAQAMGASAADALVYSKDVGAAMQAALKSTLSSIAGQAFVWAIYATGLGFYRLAMQQYDLAAQAFTAAAVWGTIGGAAAAIGRSIPGGDTTSAGKAPAAGAETPAAAASPPPALAPGAASAAASQSAAPIASSPIYITIQGDYLALPQAQDHLIKVIDDAVTKRDVQLRATRALKPTYAVR